jgi:hypothetical protein
MSDGKKALPGAGNRREKEQLAETLRKQRKFRDQKHITPRGANIKFDGKIMLPDARDEQRFRSDSPLVSHDIVSSFEITGKEPQSRKSQISRRQKAPVLVPRAFFFDLFDFAVEFFCPCGPWLNILTNRSSI